MEKSDSFVRKQDLLKKDFAQCTTNEAIYHRIIEWGKKLPAFEESLKIEENRVLGCQSLMYLHCDEDKGRLHFFASSDALISSGLAALLVFLYSGETAEDILKNPPHFFAELGITTSLTPTRVNGFGSLYQKMKQYAIKTLIATQTSFND